MAAAAAGVDTLSGRYALALFSLADERKALDAVAENLRELQKMIDSSADLRRLIHSPVIAREAQGKAMAALLERAGAHPIVANLVGLAARNRRLFLLPAIIGAFLREVARRRGEITAEVVSAAELSAAQLAALKVAIERARGGQVSIEPKVDPRLLGGLMVRIGSRLIDSSLSSKLQRLQFAMKGVG
jgi:F-type H+-transporting ATPase subunit delta